MYLPVTRNADTLYRSAGIMPARIFRLMGRGAETRMGNYIMISAEIMI